MIQQPPIFFFFFFFFFQVPHLITQHHGTEVEGDSETGVTERTPGASSTMSTTTLYMYRTLLSFYTTTSCIVSNLIDTFPKLGRPASAQVHDAPRLPCRQLFVAWAQLLVAFPLHYTSHHNRFGRADM
ncbi:hypothetical protein QR685DRAFT_355629 [Neurospora intermedia]|uniref:Secreted protein n=1 Tax=Neurospora intermedia TaxID=5142 RepID=A0ABR3D5Q8_NEUIN